LEMTADAKRPDPPTCVADETRSIISVFVSVELTVVGGKRMTKRIKTPSDDGIDESLRPNSRRLPFAAERE
jgi:hypothetical protein